MGKISDLFVNIGAKTDDFKKGISEIKSETSSLDGTIKKIGGAIAGAFATEKLIEFAKQCSEIGGAAETVEIAFKRLNNPDLLGELQAATKGTVDNLTLMKTAVQANSLGIPLKNLGTLLEFAHQRAEALGGSTDEFIQQLITGIGRKSTRALSDLGVSVLDVKNKFKDLDPALLSNAEIAKKFTEIAEEGLKKVGSEGIEPNIEKIERMSTTWKNMKIETGKAINSVIGFVYDLGGKLDAFVNSERLNKFQKFWFIVTGQTISKTNQFIKEQAEDEKLATQTAQIFDQWLLKNVINQKDFVQTSQKLRPIYDDILNKWIDVTKEIDKSGKVSRSQLYIQDRYKKQLDVMDKYMVDNEGAFAKIFSPQVEGENISGIIESLEKQLEDLKKKIKSETDPRILYALGLKAKEVEERLANINGQLSGEMPKGIERAKSLPGKVTGEHKIGIDFAKAQAAQLQSELNQTQAQYQDFADNMTDISSELQSSIQSGISSLAQNLGNVFAGTMNIGDAFLSAMADFLSNLGEQMIALGVAKIAMDTLLSIPGGGVGLLAAGIALVALAGVAKATMKSGVGSSGGSTSTSSGAYSGTGQQDLTIHIEGITKGSDIHWSQKNYDKKLSSTIAG